MPTGKVEELAEGSKRSRGNTRVSGCSRGCRGPGRRSGGAVPDIGTASLEECEVGSSPVERSVSVLRSLSEAVRHVR